jgi:2-polyprenyl-3-methyl-5-hydroxy-6-metoxy-1,4-benzoquinol methylase
MPKQQRSTFERGVTPIPAAFIALLLHQFQLTSNDRILEIGCGEGYLARALSPHVAHVDAVDERAATLARAHAYNNSPRVQYIQSRAQEFALRGRYDLVISLEAFHLIDDQANELRRLVSELAPGGSFCVAWVEFFWEAGLFESFADVFSQFGVEWGSSANLAVVDLERLAATVAPEFELEYGVRSVEVPEHLTLVQIVNYMSCTSKAEAFSRLSKARLRRVMLRRFRQAGVPEEVVGCSRYVAEFVRTHADD